MADPLFGPVFHVSKLTGTHADALFAVGLADLLRDAAPDGKARLEDAGTEIRVHLTTPVGRTDLTRIAPHAGYDYLCPNVKSRSAVPPGVKAIDYIDEKARVDRYHTTRQSLRKAGKTDAEILQALQRDRPRGDWRQLQTLNGLQGDDASNRVYLAIRQLRPEQFVDMVAQGLKALAQGEPSGVNLGASAVQLFAPLAAKGYARLKPDGTDRNDKTVAAWADDFVEWLRYRGYFRIACPRLLKKDVRVLVPAPAEISVECLSRLSLELLAIPLGRAQPQVDVLATLALARLLVQHSHEYEGTDAEPLPDLFLAGKTPASVVHGIYVTHYQSMGSAKTVAQMSLLGLPGWFIVDTAGDALDWVAILDEHRAILRRLEPDHGDEVALLADYRSFLQSRDEAAVEHLLCFLGKYGAFLMRARASGRTARAFRSDHVRRILMGITPSLSSILDDPGFEAIADAVRKATVSAQSLKTMGKDHREIRYGLLADIRRTLTLPGDAFVRCIGDFVSKYNSENARRQEMKKPRPPSITTDQLAAFVRVVEQQGAPLVGSLLAAYASCRKVSDTEVPDVGTEATLETAAAEIGKDTEERNED
jgi:hypothetical protein